jgi:hypothetical protein
MADPLSSVLPPAYDSKVALSWELLIMVYPIICLAAQITDMG